MTFKIPATLGKCADRLYKLKELASEKRKELEVLEEEASAIREHIIETLPKSDASGVSGKFAHVKVVTSTVPTVKDWDSFYAYIHKHKSYELLNRKPTAAAIQERWDAGKEIPGVERFNVVKVSLTKV